MPVDPYAVLRALVRAEAARSAPKPPHPPVKEAHRQEPRRQETDRPEPGEPRPAAAEPDRG
ncbi:hypothetical protein ACWDSD_06905 [Streptomyces spiralis]|uniref:Uncharacterized protein n=1 Tax=Streptomyces spiralis TaxID=66376 RepID=A0A919DTA5_9ACTN|nr:hypothetical protein [Streptomyces spiralis]GHE82539.1 hypothetical protein GCM10014715_42880 [Streptomyces spiralis]